MEEKKLLESLKRGDEKAFDAIFRRYGDDLFYFSLDMMHDQAEAEEILQETFLRVWEGRKAIDPERNFRNYLISIAKNLMYNVFRRRLVARKYELAANAPLSSSETEKVLHLKDLQSLLLAGIDRLAPHQREVLVLKSQGLSNEEIASALNITRKTVEYHLAKAYKQLRTDLHNLKEDFRSVMPLILCLL